MTTSLGGVTLPDPIYDYAGVDGSQNDIGARNELANGSFVYDYVGSRRVWKLAWTGLTDANKLLVTGAFLLCTTQALVLPDGSAATVLCTPGSLRAAWINDADGLRRWRVSFAVEESTV